MSIRLRLTLWYSGLLAAALVAFGVAIYGVVYKITMSSLRNDLNQVAYRVDVNALMSSNGINLNANLPQGFDASIYGIQLVNFAQDRNGRSIEKTPNLYRLDITFPVPKYNQVEPQDRYFSYKAGGASFLVIERPLIANHTLLGLLQVAMYTGREQQLLLQLQTILWMTGLLGLLTAFLLGMFLSRKALRPIGRVTAAAEQIQSGMELGLRIPREKPNDEIGRLTDTLNGMLARIEKAYKELEESNAAQRRFVSDASHELRTPLTTIRGNVDLLQKIWLPDGEAEGRRESAVSPDDCHQMSVEAVRDISDEARRMSALVNDLLSLARADTGYRMDMEPLPLRQVAEEAARRAQFLPRKAEWIIGPLEALDKVWVLGSRDYLLQLLFILIENGFKYTPAGEVRLYASRLGDMVGLTVEDTGIGMNPEDVPHIFERFYRADRSRGQTSGTGLGLSIAKWISDMHKGRLEVESMPGRGSKFTFWLPVRSQPVAAPEVS
ncbi:HAMP domain-containing histidine kinase [Cohnella pontilimi]|uniref:histidine kinase n=1 Tax=Cohnella pontilimi TaxID=2564100 RepID=A0A4U0F8H7_9BACL|nr:HAMP domain-containing sensor histidine kinase [Cohnella pontilimi]TJY41043.1 HAMP domain-containing histidine kinase [Cohnella pontilimi]